MLIPAETCPSVSTKMKKSVKAEDIYDQHWRPDDP